jgi:hypothetical protein
MESEGKSIRLETLESIHETKTGALLNFSVMAAVDIAQVEQNTAKNLDEFSLSISSAWPPTIPKCPLAFESLCIILTFTLSSMVVSLETNSKAFYQQWIMTITVEEN